MKKLFILILVFISFLGFTQSEIIDYTFDSEVYQKERTVSVFIPVAYTKDSASNFVVAYLFDGQFQPYFSMVSSMMSYYEQTDEGQPMIIVGIHSESRWDEFVPTPNSQEASTTEGADKLSLFLLREVIPLIDSAYRTKKFKIGIGHSLGGTYVINEVIKENSIFNAVIAVSPNLRMYDEQIIDDAKAFFSNNSDNRRFIYASAGTSGSMELSFQKSLLRLDSISSSASLQNMFWKCDILQGENHMTTFIPTYNEGYLALSSKLILMDEELIRIAENPQLNVQENLKSFYKELSLFTDEEQVLNVNLLMKHAHTLYMYRKYKASIELYQFAQEVLENEDLPLLEKKEVEGEINTRLTRVEFMSLAAEAKDKADAGDYIKASELYIKAFKIDLIKATHFVRMDAIPVLAQAGEIEEAFVQLDLLANRFELGGNGGFIDDPLCEPLREDKRWEKIMNKLAKNKELYK
ncbi:MAG: hypothetical protein COA33_006650 [Fluviicola sp.]|nr:hypothetical protein [Fluviicola sp.]